MKKRFGMLLVCLLLACSAAMAECAVCGGDGVCDECGGLGYVTMKAYQSDEQIKVICTGGCENGVCTACAQPVKAYTFQDRNVEKAVRAVLGKQDGQAVTLEEIQTITELDLSGAGVKRLSDVCRMVALQELNLSDNNLKNLPPLDTLTELRTLNLSGNRLTNFACLKKLSKLETLDITGNLVRDRSVINALPALQNLITEAVTPAPAATPAPNGMFLRRGEKAEPVGDTLTIEVIIGSETRTHTITTTETSVLDALLNAHLISGEEVAWGYNVTMVDGVVANYNAKGEYWVILEYVNGQYESMADSLANRKVRDGDRYAFSLMD